jgi:fructokinase
MITVAGEALIDVVVGAAGSLTALPGGAPFNVARTVARLGGQSQFVGRLSDDPFGERLRAALERDGVQIAVSEPTLAGTTLALAQLDALGTAQYRFYLDGTSASQLRREDLRPGVLAGSEALVLGGLGIVIEPTAETLRELVNGRPPGITTMLDPNCRAGAIADLDAYRRMIRDLMRHVDIVKVSTDDLRLLAPRSGSTEAARALLALGPAAVLVTGGSRPVGIHTPDIERSLPVPAVEVVDTIGAGDAFVAAFLTWWTSHSMKPPQAADQDALVRATEAAIGVGVAACTTPGAELPPGFAWRL